MSVSAPRAYGDAHFLNYSNDTAPFVDNARIYCESARSVGFATARHYREEDLRASPFWEQNAAILELKRGAGYWLWKPWIILETLRSLPAGDILVYNDVGRFAPGSFVGFDIFPAHLLQLTALLPKQFLFGFINPWMTQISYTKPDCFHLMEAETEEMLLAPQVGASWSVWMASDAAFAFLEEWLAHCRDIRKLDDSVTMEPHPKFQDHRHDQAIASILMHRTGGHYLDFTREGSHAVFRKVKAMTPDRGNFSKHVLNMNRIIAAALPDDFLSGATPGTVLVQTKLVGNLTPGQPIPKVELTETAGERYERLLTEDRPAIDWEAFLAAHRPKRGWRYILAGRGPDADAAFRAAVLERHVADLEDLAAAGGLHRQAALRKSAEAAVAAAMEAHPPDLATAHAEMLYNLLPYDERQIIRQAASGQSDRAMDHATRIFAAALHAPLEALRQTQLAPTDAVRAALIDAVRQQGAEIAQHRQAKATGSATA